jgi:hypothetical protein
MVPVNCEAAELEQALLVFAVRQIGDRRPRAGRGFGFAARIVERAAGGDGRQHGVEMGLVALFDAAADQFALLGVPFSIT